jgi:DNA processing protein
MKPWSEDKKSIIAYHLISFYNQRARSNIIRLGHRPGKIFELSRNELLQLGFRSREIHNLRENRDKIVSEEISRIENHNIQLVFQEDPLYPPLLANIYDPPPYLYVLGDPQTLVKDSLSVVGSRKATSYGYIVLDKILSPVIQAGIVVTSGMAYGIDSAAHKIAITKKGRTIGVNPGGLLHLYPKGKRSLIEEIIQNGCVISEFPLDLVPRPFYFPVRNRIISGLSKCVLVAEATFKSGSLITARLALDQNRDVLTIPGRIDSPQSQGCNFLIQQGAKLISGAGDVLSEYGIDEQDTGEKLPPLTKAEKKILDLMETNSVKSIDHFVERLDISTSEIISTLIGLRLKNLVYEEEGGYKRY